jgi:carbamoyltransferase
MEQLVKCGFNVVQYDTFKTVSQDLLTQTLMTWRTNNKYEIDGIIVAAVQEERFTRVNHTEFFPANAIKYCLEEAGLTIDEIDCVVFYEKPFLKFERLLQTYYSFAPRGLFSFLKSMPIWLKEKLFLKKQLWESLNEIGFIDRKKTKLLFTTHHHGHAASAFFASPFHSAVVLVIDGVGEWSTISIWKGEENNLQMIKEVAFPHSVGLLYSAFTYFLGFKVNSGEYKLMGLAPFGNKESLQTQNYVQLIKTNLVDIKADGSIWLDQKFFAYATGLKMIDEKKWENLFGFGVKNSDLEFNQNHCDLALAIQLVIEEIVLKLARHAKEVTGESKLCLAGGVALNCVSNAKILEADLFDEVYAQPAAGDAGGSLGAALAVHYQYYGQSRNAPEDAMKGCYLGPSFSEKEILSMCKFV